MSSPAEESHISSPKTLQKQKGQGERGKTSHREGMGRKKTPKLRRALATYQGKFLASTRTAPRYKNHEDTNEREDTNCPKQLDDFNSMTPC